VIFDGSFDGSLREANLRLSLSLSLSLSLHFRRFAEGGGPTEPSGSGPRDDLAEILGSGRSDRAEPPGEDSRPGEGFPLGSWTETAATSPGT